MNTPSSSRLWTDDQLASAVKASTSWRGVMRVLGLKTTSASEIRIMRRHVARLELDASHFRGKRRWSDDQLQQAVAECRSWEEVVTRLGLSTISGNVQAHVKSHTIRLGLDTEHLQAGSHVRGRRPERSRRFPRCPRTTSTCASPRRQLPGPGSCFAAARCRSLLSPPSTIC